ncbi:hypothetical protein BV22DRAFT_582692 [Leucogyrophana mollusca]|uniref:Uncharacterized protein n=1 Tax=Leucogyrophana mollusca TaxID=85980 RepID=A0ACB8BDD6_9AGAM|nr:hypothetical protein BV22DRAFT_582692 [Leucogyrophana mollusca]
MHPLSSVVPDGITTSRGYQDTYTSIDPLPSVCRCLSAHCHTFALIIHPHTMHLKPIFIAGVAALTAALVGALPSSSATALGSRYAWTYYAIVTLYSGQNGQGTKQKETDSITTSSDSLECHKCVPIQSGIKGHLESFWFDPQQSYMSISFYKDTQCETKALGTYHGECHPGVVSSAVRPAVAYKVCHNSVVDT